MSENRSSSMLLRWIIVELALLLPLGVLGWLVGGRTGVEIAFVVSAFGFFILVSSLERLLVRLHQAKGLKPVEYPGLSESYAQAMRGTDRPPLNPRLLVFEDPSPNVLMARSLFGPGTLLLSQGLIQQLSEAQLRAVLRNCDSQLASPTLVLRSLCAVIASWIFRLAPAPWMAVLIAGETANAKLDPVSFLRFLSVFPLGSFFVRMGGDGPFWGDDVSSSSDPAFGDALRKIDSAISQWSPSAFPGALTLYLRNPWMKRNVLPLAPFQR